MTPTPRAAQGRYQLTPHATIASSSLLALSLTRWSLLRVERYSILILDDALAPNLSSNLLLPGRYFVRGERFGFGHPPRARTDCVSTAWLSAYLNCHHNVSARDKGRLRFEFRWGAGFPEVQLSPRLMNCQPGASHAGTEDDANFHLWRQVEAEVKFMRAARK